MISRLKDLWQHRELLLNMTRKELKVKYKRSVLGFLWSFLNPLIMLAVFSLVFRLLFHDESFRWFAVFLIAGLFPWLFFVNSLMQSTTSVVMNPGLVKKVYFPREILPLASVSANIFHFFIMMLVLLVFLLIAQWHFSVYIVLFPAVFLMQVCFTLGLSFFVSAANVYLRDVQHFVELATMTWFWLCPIVYPIGLVANEFPNFMPIYLLNPMTNIVLAWQYIIYNPNHYASGADATVAYIPFWGMLYTALLSVFLLVAGYYFFSKTERGFAEQI